MSDKGILHIREYVIHTYILIRYEIEGLKWLWK